MKVILLERIARLGQMGDEVTVKPGYARNYLLPQKKALRANKANREYFESQRVQLEAQNLERKKDAEAIAGKIEGNDFIVIRQAGDTGQLYGSVSTRDIAETIGEGGFTILRNQVMLDRPIKILGLHAVRISLHPEVEVEVRINVARTEEEAERQARGEDMSVVDDGFELEEDEEAISAEDVFEDEALAEQAASELIDEGEEAPASDEGASGATDSQKSPDETAGEENKSEG
jgi:large subunit ribosomal protein L9